jgi:hypothetical protein
MNDWVPGAQITTRFAVMDGEFRNHYKHFEVLEGNKNLLEGIKMTMG